jgi:Tol biopolymer transport system component
MKHFCFAILMCVSFIVKGQQTKRSITIEDVLAIKSVRQVEVSPDEKWIAFTISTIDTTTDKSNTRIWMISTEGGDPIAMTSEDYSAGNPRWSPDGKYLSFTASKGDKAKTQVWNLNRLGGEAQQVTKIKQGVSGYEWSPDGKRLLLILKDPKPTDLTKDTMDDEKAFTAYY